MIDRSSVAAAITLGCVIRGETTHDQHINRAVSLALMDLMQSSGKPVALGLLTCNTLEQPSIAPRRSRQQRARSCGSRPRDASAQGLTLKA